MRMRLTVQNLNAARDEIKAAALACDGTPTAKLVAVLIAAGITDTKEIADILGIKVRAVQVARKRTTVRATECGAPQCAQLNAPAHQDAQESAPQCAKAHHNALPEPRVYARIETPSGLLTPIEDLDSPPSVPPKPEAKAKRGTRLADDWHLPDEWRQWARINFAHVSDEMVRFESDKFRDYWIAKPGKDGRKLNWQATWCNWCRTAFAAKPSSQPLNNGRASWDEQKAKRQADTRAFMQRMGLGTEAVQ